jgi:20S proteasome alpha/beta subunit
MQSFLFRGLILIHCLFLSYCGQTSLPFFSASGTCSVLEAIATEVEKGAPVMGMRCSDGIILLTMNNKPIPRLQVRGPQKMFPVDSHVMIGTAGMYSHSSFLVEAARNISELKYMFK